MLAMYVPSWSGAIQNLPVQLLLLIFTAIAIYRFAIQRHKRASIILALTTASISCWCCLLLVPWLRQGFSERSVIAFFELKVFLWSGFAGLIAGWILLETISFIWRKFA
jgi:hypothetical protein